MNYGISAVELRVTSPPGPLTGLDRAEAKLRSLDTLIKQLQARLAGFSTGAAFKFNAKQFQARLEEAIPLKGRLPVKRVARALGFPDVADVEAYARNLERTLWDRFARLQKRLDELPLRSPQRGVQTARKRIHAELDELRRRSLFTGPDQTTLKGLKQAGQFAEAYAREARKQIQQAERSLLHVLGLGKTRAPKPPPPPAPPPPLTAALETIARKEAENRMLTARQRQQLERVYKQKPELYAAYQAKVSALRAAGAFAPSAIKVAPTAQGNVPLTVPAKQIVAKLGPGTIKLLVPAKQIIAQAGGAVQAATRAGAGRGAAAAPPAAGGGAGGLGGRGATMGAAPSFGPGGHLTLAREAVTVVGRPLVQRTLVRQLGQTIEREFLSGKLVKEVHITNRAKALWAELNAPRAGAKAAGPIAQIRQQIQADLAAEMAKPIHQRDLGRLQAIVQKGAAQIRALATPELVMLGLEPKIQQLARQVETSAGQVIRDNLQRQFLAINHAFQRELVQAGPGTARARAMQAISALRTPVLDKTHGRLFDAMVYRVEQQADRAERALAREQQRLAERRERQARRTQQAFATIRQRQAERREREEQKVADWETKRQERAIRRRMTREAAEAAQAQFLARGGSILRTTGVPGQGPVAVVLRRDVGPGQYPFLPQGGTETMFIRHGARESVVRQVLAARGVGALEGEQGLLRNVLTGDFLRNTAKVTAWTASVAALYKTVQLATISLQGFIETTAQTARLEQVFSGIGGSAQELARDVIHLAAVNGRSAQEAMESAVQWSRLGLNRVQVNEAVRISLMAANVAELTAAEATLKLQAIFQNYHLSVADLRRELGELNQISNTYNVTNADLLEGIARSAAVAKAAGISLSELRGIIGATVGATAQSGSNIGNAVKSVLTALGNPALQQRLREQFQFEVTTGRGDLMKSGSDILADLFLRYQKLNEEQQRALLFVVAGKTQSTRFAAMLDNYIRAQWLAVNAQLHLNSAEEENAKIKATLRAQLTGLTAEWTRFVNIQGRRGPGQALTEITAALRNLLTIANAPGMATVTTLVGGMLGMAGMRAFSATMFGKDTFGSRTLARIRDEAMAVKQASHLLIAAFLGEQLVQHPRTGRNIAIPPNTRIVTDTRTNRLALAYPIALAMDASRNPWASSNLQNKWRWNPFTWGASAVEPLVRGLQRLELGWMGSTRALRAFNTMLQLSLITLGRWALPLTALYGVITGFNRLMDYLGASAERAQSRLAGFDEAAQTAGSAAAAMAQAARLLQTVQGAFLPEKQFGVVPRERQARILEQALPFLGAYEADETRRQQRREELTAQLRLLQQQNDAAGILHLLEAERERYLVRQREELQKQYVAQARTAKFAEAEMARLKALQQHPLWRHFFAERRAQTIAQYETQSAESRRGMIATLEQEDDAYERRHENDERAQQALAAQKATLEAIADLYEALGNQNPFEKVMAGLASVEARLKAVQLHRQQLETEQQTDLANREAIEQQARDLEAREKELRARLMSTEAAIRATQNPPTPAGVGFGGHGVQSPMEQQARLRELNAQRSEIEAQLEVNRRNQELLRAGRLPGVTPPDISRRQAMINKLAEQESELLKEREKLQATQQIRRQQAEMELGREAGKRRMIEADWGESQTERILRQREEAARRIAELEQKPQRTAAEQGELYELLGGQYQRMLELARRRAEIEREVRNQVVEQAREFRASIWQSGPREMLRKLTALRLAQTRSLSPEQLLGFSPAMRTDLLGASAALGKAAPWAPGMLELLREQQLNEAALPADLNQTLMTMSERFGQLLSTENLPLPVKIVEGGGGAAQGGLVRGGSGTRDDVPIMAMGGEYILPRDVVQRWGVEFFESLRAGRVRGFASGGIIDLPGGVHPSYLDTKTWLRAVGMGSANAERTILQQVADTYGSISASRIPTGGYPGMGLHRFQAGVNRVLGPVGRLGGGAASALGFAIDPLATAAGGMSAGQSPTEALADRYLSNAASRDWTQIFSPTDWLGWLAAPDYRAAEESGDAARRLDARLTAQRAHIRALATQRTEPEGKPTGRPPVKSEFDVFAYEDERVAKNYQYWVNARAALAEEMERNPALAEGLRELRAHANTGQEWELFQAEAHLLRDKPAEFFKWRSRPQPRRATRPAPRAPSAGTASGPGGAQPRPATARPMTTPALVTPIPGAIPATAGSGATQAAAQSLNQLAVGAARVTQQMRELESAIGRVVASVPVGSTLPNLPQATGHR